jgi:hypothetical protein
MKDLPFGMRFYRRLVYQPVFILPPAHPLILMAAAGKMVPLM